MLAVTGCNQEIIIYLHFVHMIVIDDKRIERVCYVWMVK